MIWLFLATWAAAVAALVWVLVGAEPWLLAAAVTASWLVGRGLVAAIAGARRQGGIDLAGALARQGADLDAARDPDAIAAVAVSGVEDAVPGAAAELWLVDEGSGWRRAGVGGSREVAVAAPAPSLELRQWLAGLSGPVPREVLSASGQAAAELGAHGPGRLVMPLAYGGRLLGLLWASGPDGLEALLDGMRRQVEGALGHASLARHVAQQTEVAADVELAATVQQAFIPGREAMRVGRIELAGSYLPASRCGGDFWACHDLGGGRALVLVGDVTGHGIGAARITAAARGAHDAAVELQGPGFALPRLFDALDAAVRRVGAGHYHMTCFAAVIDGQRRVRFAGAGHVSPYVCRRGPDGVVAIDALVGRGNPLGMGAKQALVEVGERQLAAGDLLLFYSDGLTDCVNPGGERLGERRMARMARELVAEPLAVDALRDRVEQQVGEFAGGAPLADDITLVVARVL
ncbi:MAG TPA: SpoIIE family protein phosphatase [Kofleriaceae bacterium]|nr:SpoIIE family protein phosphatase [Kofleriaceae bacterium]